MVKAILMSIKPKWVKEILNGNKTIEIRKRFPKDYVGWVYIYCTKDKKYANLINRGGFLTGMVVARFWCDKVEEINKVPLAVIGNYLKNACLSVEELHDYSHDYKYKTFAIYITKLEIFDKPKEISEFYKLGAWKVYEEQLDSSYMKRTEQEIMKSLGQVLTLAPQSWCYVEV